MKSRAAISLIIFQAGTLLACSKSGDAPGNAAAGSGGATSSSGGSTNGGSSGETSSGGTSNGGGSAATAGQGGTEDGGELPDRFVVADGQDAPAGIATDDTLIYFANRDAGTIVTCPLEGCGSAEPSVLVSDQDHPIAVAVDATHLYWVTGWVDGDTGAPASRPVFSCELPGCDAASIEAFDQGPYQPYGLAVTADRIFLAAWPNLAACPIAGCGDSGELLAGGPFVSVDADASWIYGTMIGLGQVLRCTNPDCSDQETLLQDIFPMSVVVDSDNVYVADYDFFLWGADAGTREGRILSCPLGGCGTDDPVVLESGAISPYSLAEHGDRLYFTNVDHGSVISLRK